MRAILVVLTVALSAFAGCTSPADPSGSETPAPSSSSTSAATTPPSTTVATTTSGPAEDNEPPVATLQAIAIGLNVTFNLTGSDPDGDEEDLSWTLDAGDDLGGFEGEGLPMQVNHSYAAPGNYTVVFVVSDGALEDEANLTLNVTVPSATLQAVSTEWTAGFGGCGSSYDPLPADAAEGGADVLWGYFAVLPETHSRSFAVTFELDAASNLGGGIDFYDAEGVVLDGGGIDFTEPYLVSGVVPVGAAFAITYSCGATGGTAAYSAG